MKNYVQEGNTITYANSTGSKISSGDVVVIGCLIAIAATDIANGSSGELHTDGVFTVPKVQADVLTQGEALVWDKSVTKFGKHDTSQATGDVAGAVLCWEAAGNTATTVKVHLDQRVGTVHA
jgi:predicted RecA/RadA family phage recombinase